MSRRTKYMQAKISPKFNTRFGNLRGMGKNTSAKIVGPKATGRKVRVPRSADSFKSRTDNT